VGRGLGTLVAPHMLAASVDSSGAYAALRKAVVDAGLLDRARRYYAWRLGVSFLLLAAGIALAQVVPPVWLLPVAALMALGSVQVALIGHDAGHLSVFAARRANALLGSLCWSLALGISFWYWNDRHNRHHASPNHMTRDPDVQWDYGPLFVPLLAFTFRIEGWRYAVRDLRGGQRLAEVVLLGIGTLAWLLPTLQHGWVWLVTLFGSQVLASVYLACVVAPNHIGMPTWSAGASPPFIEQQLLSSRNVAPGRISDFLFGGLNYQIEHHLFPTMPRTHFAAARALVKPFCAERGLPYNEFGVVAAYRLVWDAVPRLGHFEPI
jgi:fatty acid desaturase